MESAIMIRQHQQQRNKICEVCGMPSFGIRCGAVACNACKKFFLRNRDNLTNLLCISGHGNCMESGVSIENFRGSDPLSRRQYCSRCRLVKCVDIGMRYFGRSSANKKLTSGSDSSSDVATVASSNNNDILSTPTVIEDSSTSSSLLSSGSASLVNNNSKNRRFSSLSHDPSNSTAVVMAPRRFECCTAEHTLKMVTTAVAELCAFQSMPWTLRIKPISNDAVMWGHAMENFNFIIQAGVSYVKILQDFKDMPVADRCLLFSRALVPHLVAQVTLPSHPNYRLFGMAQPTRQKFLHYFPIYKVLDDNIEEIASVMEAWDPSFPEFALLQAMVFFRCDNLAKLTCPGVVRSANFRLAQTLDWYLERSDNAAIKKYLFFRVFDLLGVFEANYTQAIAQFSNDRPDLVHLNKVFSDMYQLPSSECEQQYRRLPLPAIDSCSRRAGHHAWLSRSSHEDFNS